MGCKKLYVFLLSSSHVHIPQTAVLFPIFSCFFSHLYKAFCFTQWGKISEREQGSIFAADRRTLKKLHFLTYLINKSFLISTHPPPLEKKKKVSNGHTRHWGGSPRAEDEGTRSDIVALGCLKGLGITAFTGMCFCSFPLYLLVPLSRWLLPQTDPAGKIID